MPNTKRTPLKSPECGRRPVRPIDREKMRPWLERHLDDRTVPGVRWTGQDRSEFEIPWRHAARHGWSIDKDACIFELWATHTKKYIVGKDKEKDPKRWKANFRCALNSLPDVERVTGTQTKGSQAVRRYRFLSPQEMKNKNNKARRSRRRHRTSDDDGDDEEEVEEVKFDFLNESNEDLVNEATPPSPGPESSIPHFEQLLSDSDVVRGRPHFSTRHMSGCQVLQRDCATPPSPPSPEPRSISPNSVESVSDSEVSHYSDEEAVETIFQIENESIPLSVYHPSYWNNGILDVMDFNDERFVGHQVECVTTEIDMDMDIEVRSVITMTPQPEYWDLSSNTE